MYFKKQGNVFWEQWQHRSTTFNSWDSEVGGSQPGNKSIVHNKPQWVYCARQSFSWEWKKWLCISFSSSLSTEPQLKKKTLRSRLKWTLSIDASFPFTLISHSFLIQPHAQLFILWSGEHWWENIWETTHRSPCIISIELFSVPLWGDRKDVVPSPTQMKSVSYAGGGWHGRHVTL